MPEQLWQTTLDPSRRMLRRLTVQDAAQAAHLFTLIMGSQVRAGAMLLDWLRERLSSCGCVQVQFCVALLGTACMQLHMLGSEQEHR